MNIATIDHIRLMDGERVTIQFALIQGANLFDTYVIFFEVSIRIPIPAVIGADGIVTLIDRKQKEQTQIAEDSAREQDGRNGRLSVDTAIPVLGKSILLDAEKRRHQLGPILVEVAEQPLRIGARFASQKPDTVLRKIVPVVERNGHGGSPIWNGIQQLHYISSGPPAQTPRDRYILRRELLGGVVLQVVSKPFE